MVEMIIKIGKIERKQRLVKVLILVAAWVMSIAVVGVCTLFVDNPAKMKMIPVASLCVMFLVFTFQYFGLQSILLSYRLAVSMGKTRYSFLVSYMVLEIISTTIMVWFTYFLYRMEVHLYSQMGIEKYEFRMDEIFQVEYMIVIVAFLSMVGFFVAGISMWNMWIPRVFWFLLCLFIGRIGNIIHVKTGLFHEVFFRLAELPSYSIMMLGVAMAALLGGIGWGIMYKMEL